MNIYKVLGLMSGTSLDGLDIAYCHIWKLGNKWEFEIKNTQSIAYSLELRDKLKSSISLSAEDLFTFDVQYGIWLGERVKEFIQSTDIEVDFIASHGHTTHHRPELGFTYQIGSGQFLSNTSGQKVICDFRSKDISMGGQGAPLVPIGDRYFFGEFDFCLNLGGICNISFENKGHRIAFDIGLANMVLNYVTEKIGLPYDNGGRLASKGKINEKLFQQLNELPYYALPYPKSTGYEWFIKEVVPIIDQYKDETSDILNTCIYHICEQIANQVNTFEIGNKFKMLVTGGGALNKYLIQVLEKHLRPNIKVIIPSKEIIEFKEALVFALMGVLKEENEPNVLSSVTGAKKNTISGIIYNPE